MKVEGTCFSPPEYIQLPSSPIVIGTVPLHSSTAAAAATAAVNAEPSAPPASDVVCTDAQFEGTYQHIINIVA